ncbi:MAG TPA: DUF2163 domain-containing protein [Hyphomicrobium sp.]|nr:DUF2163 domain-containing protein [Hyphomicrobium sp.]
MKLLPAGLDAHLATRATTLCWCWRLTRNDGGRFGFTDHDKALTFDGTTFEASAGFTASDIKDGIGLSVDNLDVSGALTSAALTDDDLSSGRYDDARVEIYRVNWQNVSQRVLMRSGSLGEVRRAGSAFSAEVRGLQHYLQQPKGRLYQYACDADLGDARCGVNLASSTYRGTATITTVFSPRRFQVSGLNSYAHDFFSRGLASFASGPALGTAIEIKSHSKKASLTTIELWVEAEGPPVVGNTLVVTAGCDKRIETCRARFANAVNFRGFPSMPGNEYLTKIARKS